MPTELMKTTDNVPLRIGVFLNGMSVKKWEYELIKTLGKEDYLEVVFFAVNQGEFAKQDKVGFLCENLNRILYFAFSFLDRKLFRSSPDAFATLSVRPVIPTGADILKVVPKETKHIDRFSSSDVERISSYQPDVIIRLGFRILKGAILNVPRYGIWSFHHGDNRINRGSPAGFWETIEKWPETGSILQILNERLDDGKVIYRSFSLTNYISVNRNKNALYWKTLDFVPRMLKQLAANGPGALENNEDTEKLNAYSAPLYKPPSNLRASVLIARHVLFVGKYYLKKVFFKQQWYLLYHYGPKMQLSFWRYRPIYPASDRLIADPFVVQEGGKHFIFVEEMPYRTKKGHISCIEELSPRVFSKPTKVIEADFHLSYPYIFKHQSSWYMVPESGGGRSIDLYIADSFPYKWSLKCRLMEQVQAVDTSILYFEERWWLFTNLAQRPGSSTKDELFLFYADDLFSADWNPHPLNPIVSDVKKARGAGRIFIQDGKIYRPAQNSAKMYGYGFSLFQITKITPTNYQEKLVTRVTPGWNKEVRSTHTINHAGNLSVIDGLRDKLRFWP